MELGQDASLSRKKEFGVVWMVARNWAKFVVVG